MSKKVDFFVNTTQDTVVTLAAKLAWWCDGNGFKGYNIRIDRLEQKSSAQQWVIRALMTAVIGLLAATGAAMII